MDAIEFIKERQRLCQTYVCCFECPANNDNDGCKFSTITGYDATEQIRLLEEWSAAHPLRTRQSELLKQYPEAALDENGIISICPNGLSLAYRNSSGGCSKPDSTCIDCRRGFWLKEIE